MPQREMRQTHTHTRAQNRTGHRPMQTLPSSSMPHAFFFVFYGVSQRSTRGCRTDRPGAVAFCVIVSPDCALFRSKSLKFVERPDCACRVDLFRENETAARGGGFRRPGGFRRTSRRFASSTPWCAIALRKSWLVGFWRKNEEDRRV